MKSSTYIPLVSLSAILVIIVLVAIFSGIKPRSSRTAPPPSGLVWCKKKQQMVPPAHCPCRQPELVWCKKKKQMVPVAQCPCRQPAQNTT